MYDINNVYQAFDIAGQQTVNISFNDRFNVTEDEIKEACVDVTYENLLPILIELTNAQPLKELRSMRDALLTQTDWVVTKALETGTSVPQEWVQYRQALRDITDTYSSLDTVIWPDKPL